MLEKKRNKELILTNLLLKLAEHKNMMPKLQKEFQWMRRPIDKMQTKIEVEIFL